MKSHVMMNLHAARKGPSDLKSSYSSTPDEEYEEDSSCGAVKSSVVLRDGESETDSSKKKHHPSSRRSKRVRRSTTCGFGRMEMEGLFHVKEPKRFEEDKGKNASIDRCSSFVDSTEPVSSIPDSTQEEDVAYCLIMLSKDKWERDHKFEYRAPIRIEEEKRSEVDYLEDFDQKVVTRSNKVRGKYKCEACNKLFRSYQALGGHRASHKKIVPETGSCENSSGGSKATVVSHEVAAVVVEERVHQCPFCPRVFKSGQALGGHKRTHFLGTSRNVIETIGPLVTKPFSRIGEILGIDLNLPAPFNDDEISKTAHSIVSDAELHQLK